MLSRVRRVSLEDLRNNYDAVAYLKQTEAAGLKSSRLGFRMGVPQLSLIPKPPKPNLQTPNPS